MLCLSVVFREATSILRFPVLFTGDDGGVLASDVFRENRVDVFA